MLHREARMHEQIEGLQHKGREIKERIELLEKKSGELEKELKGGEAKRYRAAVREELCSTYCEAFHQRDSLIGPCYGDMAEWRELKAKMDACRLAVEVLPDFSAIHFRSWEHMREHVREKLSTRLEKMPELDREQVLRYATEAMERCWSRTGRG